LITTIAGIAIFFIRFGRRDIEYAANTSRRGERGEMNRASLCAIVENASITPPMTNVYIDIGYDASPWMEKGRYVVNNIGSP
jgi:hypothetical protein